MCPVSTRKETEEPEAPAGALPSNTFSDKVERDAWPPFLLPVIDSQTDPTGRDKMLLGTLTLVSGLLTRGLYGIYDRRHVYAPFYTILYGGFATGKGDLEACRQLLAPLKQEMRRQYEREKAEWEEQKAAWNNQPKASRGAEPAEPPYRTPVVPANSSASAVYRALDANGGWGVMFETEADSLTNMLSKSEYGDYSDLLRKAHHHEDCSMVRVTDHVKIELDAPRLAVFLTCTGSQLPLLLPATNVANGLASRFLFYALPQAPATFRNVFERAGESYEELFRPLGEQLLDLHHELTAREGRPVEFCFTPGQQAAFVDHFDLMLREQNELQGEGIQGFILRLALEAFRYGMVLTALRRLSLRTAPGTPVFAPDEQTVVCDERDFQTVITLIDCLVNHTARIYAIIGKTDSDPFGSAPGMPADLARLCEALPRGRDFPISEAFRWGGQQGLGERTIRRMMGRLISKYQVVERVKYATYRRVERKEGQA